MGRLGRLWKTANEIKSAWEWALVIAAFIGVPVAPIVIGFVTGASLDVLLLYLVAAVAFWFVFVNEGILRVPMLRQLREVLSLLTIR